MGGELKVVYDPEADVRRVEVGAAVDAGATHPALPEDFGALGLA